MSFGVAIVGLAVLILIHEAGHFVAARLVGMTPRKFYLGFGPPIVKTVRNGVEYGIGSLPLGGYVKIPGMHRPAPGDLRATLKPDELAQLREPLDALDSALERGDEATAREQLPKLEPLLAKNRQFRELDGQLSPEAYWRQKAWKRIVVIGAGPLTNIVFAIALFAAVYVVGVSVYTRQVESVLGGHPAAAAGLRAGDEIVTVDGHRVQPDTISKRINATHGKPFRIVVRRDGKRVVIGPLRAKLDQGNYRVGFVVGSATGPGDSIPTAVWKALRDTGQVTSETTKSLAGLAHGKGTKNISSSVGIVRDTSQAYRYSLQDFFFVLGLVSLAIAILNLLPVLPLDGGHIVMSVLESVRGRAYSQLAYARFSALGITLFMFLLYLGLRNDLGSGGG